METLRTVATVLSTALLFSNAVEATFPLTGVKAGVNIATGQRPSRTEIRDFQHSGPAWDLYIQSLQQLEDTDQSDPLSYFAFAGKFSHFKRMSGGMVTEAFCGYLLLLRASVEDKREFG
jgi:tyrosinase